MAAKWLLKSDPDEYSFDDLVRDGKTVWEGVSNNLALKSLRNILRANLALVYHAAKERAVVGLAESTSDPYPDPNKRDPRLVVVEVAAKEKLARPVSLDEIKKHADLKDFDLVRLPPLSVMPVSERHWNAIQALASEGAIER